MIGEHDHWRMDPCAKNILMGEQILSERMPANKKRGRTYLLPYLLPSSNTKLVLIVRTLMTTLS